MWTPDQERMLKLLEQEELLRKGERLKASLIDFVRHFWRVIEPKKAFKDNWHIHVECDHLQALENGEFKNLIMNVPPGSSKSTIVSVMFPAWLWARNAGRRIFGASYSEPLSIRDAMLCRAVILDPEYQAMFTEVRIKQGADQKTQYDLTSGGWRMATSVGGRGTGMHPDVKIIDDPHNVKQSESDTERENALNWYDGTMSSRGLIHDAMTIVIMQRLHQKDLTGHIMASEEYQDGDWAHVIIPMEYEVKREYPVPKLPWKDPRTEEGQLMWPEVFTAKKVKKLAATLGSYRAAGQLQQRPAPAGGGILVVKHFQLWPAKKPLPDFTFVVQSYDTAFTDQTQNDPTACTVFAVFDEEVKDKQVTQGVMILDFWTDWMKFPELREKMMEDWDAEYGGRVDARGRPDQLHPARRPDAILIEEKGSGISIIQELRRANAPVKTYNPGKASKIARAQAASAVLESDHVWVLESKKEPGKPVTWVRPLLTQCEEFPNGEHDDGVDTLTQSLIFLNHSGLLVLSAIEDEVEEERDYEGEKVVNPYG